ncbi:MAG: hypothetical protein WCT19_02100 [Candidatus Paceibacterota bacterium]|jgi:primosomal protein N'
MKIVEVIPISRGISKESFSYFTGADVLAGSIVKVPIRSKFKSGVVISVRSAADSKSDIRSAPFELKKIEELKSQNLFLPEFMDAAKECGDFFASVTGSVLNSIIPKTVLEKAERFYTKDGFPRCIGIHEKLVFQAEDEERFARYRSIIREEFAKKSSIFFCVPTKDDIANAFEVLSKGIENYVFCLDNDLPPKKMAQIWNATITEDHPVLIIGTGQFLSLPRLDLNTIIIEKESSRSYKKDRRPYVDFRIFAEIFSKKMNCRIIFGDSTLRMETIWRNKTGELGEIAPLQFRSLISASQIFADLSKKEGAIAPQKFEVLSPELKTIIKTNKENSENLFIFSGRRGLSLQTICADCGNVVVCSRCLAPLVLHKKGDLAEDKKYNFFLCHKCGEKRSADERCKNCDSWRLKTFGIGIELLEEEIRKNFEDVKIFRVDKDTTASEARIKEVISKFYASPGSVLLGTELALGRLNKKIQNGAIASIDSFFSLPDFRVGERVLQIILKVRSLSEKTFLIQTRSGGQRSIKYGFAGNLLDYYKEEISDREKFGYPPFVTLIKISLSGKKETVREEMEKISGLFKEYKFSIFPAFIESKNGKFNLNAVIKIPAKKWVDYSLLAKLRSLPPYFSVTVDPESLL